MAGKTIYDRPDPSIHRNWALRQEAVDEMRRQGMSTADGSVESQASRAARIHNITGQVPALERLWGLDRKASVALWREPKEYAEARSWAPYTVPELGPPEGRMACEEAIRRELRREHPGETSLVQQEADSLLSEIEQTLYDDQMIAEVRGRMAELMADR